MDHPADPNVFETANAGFAQALYEDYLRDPNSVRPTGAACSRAAELASAPPPTNGAAAAAAKNGGRRARRRSQPTRPPLRPRKRRTDQGSRGPAGAEHDRESLGPHRNDLSGNLRSRRSSRPEAGSTPDSRQRAAPRRRRSPTSSPGRWSRPRSSIRVMAQSFAHGDGAPHRVTPDGIHLGLAVDVERKDGSRGLVVPVLKHAEKMRYAEFQAAYDVIVEKARTNKLMPDDFAGGSMTLTNPGGLGTVASVPRLMAGQGSIIAVGAIAYPPEFAGTLARHHRPARLEQGDDDHQHLRSPGDSGRRVGRVPPHRRAAACRRRRVLRGDLRRRSAWPIRRIGRGAQTRQRRPAPRQPPAVRRHPSSVLASESVRRSRICLTSPPRWRWSRRIRTHGHLAARLDPLGSEPSGDPALDPDRARPHPRGDGDNSRTGAPHRRSRRDPRRRAAQPAGHLLRHDRLRSGARQRSRPAGLAAPGDRIGRPSPPRCRRKTGSRCWTA